MRRGRLLIVEDDPALRSTLEDALKGEGYEVSSAADGLRGEELLFGRSFDGVLLDVMLPGKGGLELLRAVRAARLALPVLLLTARGDENDKVLGLELGADDYVTKPFGLRELLARVVALLRRGALSRGLGAGREGPSRFQIGSVVVDLECFQILRGKESFPLTPTEAAMLNLLFLKAGQVVSRAAFLEEVWEGGEMVTQRTVDTHMLNLRQKVERDPRHPRHLLTVHGVGYRLLLDEA